MWKSRGREGRGADGKEEGGGEGEGVGRRRNSGLGMGGVTGEHTQSPFVKLSHVSLVVTDHSIFKSAIFLLKASLRHFSRFAHAPHPPLCYSRPSTPHLWTDIPQTPVQISQPELASFPGRV